MNPISNLFRADKNLKGMPDTQISDDVQNQPRVGNAATLTLLPKRATLGKIINKLFFGDWIATGIRQPKKSTAATAETSELSILGVGHGKEVVPPKVLFSQSQQAVFATGVELFHGERLGQEINPVNLNHSLLQRRRIHEGCFVFEDFSL